MPPALGTSRRSSVSAACSTSRRLSSGGMELIWSASSSSISIWCILKTSPSISSLKRPGIALEGAVSGLVLELWKGPLPDTELGISLLHLHFFLLGSSSPKEATEKTLRFLPLRLRLLLILADPAQGVSQLHQALRGLRGRLRHYYRHAKLSGRANVPIVGDIPEHFPPQHTFDLLRLNVARLIRGVDHQLHLLLRIVPGSEHIDRQESVLEAGHVHCGHQQHHGGQLQGSRHDVIERTRRVQDHVIVRLRQQHDHPLNVAGVYVPPVGRPDRRR